MYVDRYSVTTSCIVGKNSVSIVNTDKIFLIVRSQCSKFHLKEIESIWAILFPLTIPACTARGSNIVSRVISFPITVRIVSGNDVA